MLRIEELAIVTAAGRPRGRANHARKDPKVVAVKVAATTKKTTIKKTTTKKITTKKTTTKKATTKKATTRSRSTKRDLSRFEVVTKRTARIGRAGRIGLAKGLGRGRG